TDTTDGEHTALQRHFTSHGNIMSYGSSGHQTHKGCCECDTCGWTILRDSTCGQVNVNVVLLKEIFWDTQLFHVCASVRHGGLSGLFHHIAKLTCELQVSFTFHFQSFDSENFTTSLCPSQTLNHTNL